MIKKILWWGIFVVLSGALIYGAVYRTVMKAGDAALNGSGQSAQGGLAGSNGTQSQGWQNDEGGNETRSSGSEEDHPLPGNWIQLEGKASQVDARTLLIVLEDGTSVLVERGAWRFALEQGFVINIGDPVRLVGFYESSDFEVVEMFNLANQSTVTLRDADGKPLWSGGNRN